VPTLLAGWANFYVISGSVAGALIGLQFVVIALVAGSGRKTTIREIATFATPTVLHFCAALFLSAVLSVPWVSAAGLRFALVGCGFAGVVYCAIVIRRARSPRGYRPDLEDWLWHTALPLVAYLTLVAAALILSSHPALALLLIAAVTLGLVFIGIHNAWDAVTHLTTHPERS
jgi:hypothetical protein